MGSQQKKHQIRRSKAACVTGRGAASAAAAAPHPRRHKGKFTCSQKRRGILGILYPGLLVLETNTPMRARTREVRHLGALGK